MYSKVLVLALLGTILSACSGDVDLSNSGLPALKLPSVAPSELQILVVGGTKGVGLETVKLALARGHEVTAMSRSPQKMTYSHKRLTKLRGDILDFNSLDKAVSGKDAVVIAIGAGPTRKPVTVFSEGTANTLKSMSNQKVRRMVAVTGIGAGDSRGHGGFFYDKILQPLLLSTIYQDKDIAEKLIAQSTSQWTIVRPGFLTDETSATNYRVIEDMSGITSGDISRSDVAHFILSSVELESYLNATVLISN